MTTDYGSLLSILSICERKKSRNSPKKKTPNQAIHKEMKETKRRNVLADIANDPAEAFRTRNEGEGVN